MSPVERRGSRAATTAVLLALGAVVASLGLLLLMVNLAGRDGGNLEVRIGDDRFNAGSAAARSNTIAEGGPILFSDVARGTRDIILQHTGADPEQDWHAFAAQAPGKPRDCFLAWQAEAGDFVDCDGDRYPADGTGLPSYPVSIEDGVLFVDLNAEFRAPAEGATP